LKNLTFDGDALAGLSDAAEWYDQQRRGLGAATMQIIITGATGRAGAAVVRASLDDASMRVIVWSRRPTKIEHPQLCERLVADFTSYESIADDLRNSSAILWCLGVSQSQVSASEYEAITLGYTIAAVQAAATYNPRIRFCFLSGGGADSTETSRVLFARIKGKAENAVLSTLDDAYCLRPGYIRSRGPVLNRRTLADRTFGLLSPVVERLAPNLVIEDTALARAMLRVAQDGANRRILENAELRRISAAET
jgi:uncharacterized protein YbjT (DUF2867 family)